MVENRLGNMDEQGMGRQEARGPAGRMARMLILTPLLELELSQESEGLTFAEAFRNLVVFNVM